MQQSMIVAGEEEGVGWSIGFDGLVEPDGATADGRAEAIELRGVDEP